MAIPKVKCFELSKDKSLKYTQISNDNLNMSKYGINSQNDENCNNLVIPSIKGNPFLYSLSEKNDTTTFEDFLIKYKRKDVLFGEIINNHKISINKKRKIIKGSFKEWKKEFEESHSYSFNDATLSTDLIKGVEVKKVKFKTFIYLLILGVIIDFLVFKPQPIVDIIFKIEFLKNFLNNIFNILSTYKYLEIMGYLSIGLIVITFIYSLIHNNISLSLRNCEGRYNSILQKSNSQVQKGFKKNYNKALKYYLKNITRRCKPFKPLTIKSMALKTNIEKIDEINKNIRSDAIKYKERLKTSMAIKKLLFACTNLEILLYLGLLIYKLL